ncbi:phage tail assembly protein [Actinomadura fibrosa]|uniref:Phage tail assembly protein n=1 Tax=Actinomadura fibrosa TaxID=111802 RepID=A0ABW2XU54_9ACTN|nr:phage tail assembly protein [Actinomadura fibrosa]
MSVLVTEVEFELPKGYVDADGTLHRTGVMRLATAADEIYPLKDPRVRNWPAYLVVLLLSRVVSRLGGLPEVNPGVIEGLFSEDLAYLQDLYNRINGLAPRSAPVECPHCGQGHEVEVAPLGG